jgi:hypothetical protein
MANDPTGSNFAFGAPRSTPRVADYFSPAAQFGSDPVASFSSRPLHQSEIGTGGITNSAGRRSRGKRGGAGIDMGLTKPEGPDLGLDSGSQQEIIDASGVQKAYEKYDNSNQGLSADEAMRASDADLPHPPSTGNPATNPDHPLLTRLRSKMGGLDLFAGE